MTPQERTALVEAVIGLATAGLMVAALTYGPDILAYARAAWARQFAPPLPMFPLNELAVSEFRAGLAGPVYTATCTGWEHENSDA